MEPEINNKYFSITDATWNTVFEIRLISNTISNISKIRKYFENIFLLFQVLATNDIETQDETTLSQTDNEFSDSPVHPSVPATTALHETPQVAKQYGGPPVRKRKLTSNNNVAARVSNVSAAIDKLDKLAEKNMSVPLDEFDVFGKHIATQLRQLPLYNALLCEEKIEDIIRQQRLQILL